MKIKLKELASALQKSDVMQGYVDIRQGKVVLLGNEFDSNAPLGDASEEEILEHILSIEDDWENCVPLPNACDCSERDAMTGFANSLQPGPCREEILSSLQGPGAAWRFRRQMEKHRLQEDWNLFREEMFRAFAREWCEENGIEYE